MSETLELQLWIIIGLLLLIVLSVLARAVVQTFRLTAKEKTDFAELWELDKVDEIIKRAEFALKLYPNRMDALYFGAQALTTKGEYWKARTYYRKILLRQPWLKDSIQGFIEEVEDLIRQNPE